MKLLSEIREEKRVKELQSENISQIKRQYLIEESIKHCLSEIEKEKESIVEALHQNFFAMAKSKIARIEELKEKELKLRRKLN